MNDHPTFEREIRVTLDDNAPSAPPNHLLQSFEFNARRTRRYPRWLALVKEPTMRNDSTLAVGSPTARIAAITIATLLLTLMLAGAGLAGARLLAADGVIVVDGSGAGDFTTISEAVATAADGDEIIVRPGTYVESVLIEKDLTLRGDGDPKDVIIQVPEDGPVVEWFQFDLSHGVFLRDSDASVRDLTIRTPSLSTSGFVVRGGSPSITNTIVDVPETPHQSARGFVYVGGGASATIEDNVTDGFTWVAEGAHATISGLRRLQGGADEVGLRVDGAGTNATATGNDLNGSIIHNGADATLSDNTFAGEGCLLAIEGAGPGVVVRRNTFTGGSQGICMQDSVGSEILDNRFEGAEIAGLQVVRADARIAENSIRAGGIGVALQDGRTELEGNSIAGNLVGLSIQTADSVTALQGNTICDNGVNLRISEGAFEPATSGNEICPDSAG